MSLKLLTEKLSVGNIKTIKRYKQGQQNKTFRIISDKGDFSFRIYTYKKLDQVEFEVSLLNHSRGLKVPRLVKIGQDYIAKIDNKPAVLYEYIPGRHISTFSEKQLKEVGEFMGEFHNRGRGFRWNKQRDRFYNLPDSRIKKIIRIAKRAKLKHLSLLPSLAHGVKQNRPNINLPTGPIHVDIKPENTLFHKRKLSGIIDFDNSCIGPIISDLTRAMIWFCIKNKKFDVQKALHVYKGYIKKRKLTKLEHLELYKALKFAFLSHTFVDYFVRATGVTSEKYFNFIINNIYEAYKNFTLSKDEFYKIFKII